jgi:hypothetical protein
MYANNELFIDAVAGGERAFMRMLAERNVVGKKLFDQMLYPLTLEQEEKCRECKPVEQDFDKAYRELNVLSRDTVRRIKTRTEMGYPNSAVITVTARNALPLYTYRHVTFFKVRDYKARRKYAMLPKTAHIKVCGRLYIALNAVNIRVETPTIVTIDG